MVGFCCLDVTGHGVAASLLAVTASHLLSPSSQRSLLRGSNDEHLPPGEVLGRLNQDFPYGDGRSQFMTITYGVLRVAQKRLTYACAGHPGPIIIRSDGHVERLDQPGFPIGVVPETIYDEHELSLDMGDRIYIYSDGVPDAQRSDGEFFEVQQLLSNLVANRRDGVSSSVERVKRAIESWCSPARARDDISLMGFELTAM